MKKLFFAFSFISQVVLAQDIAATHMVSCNEQNKTHKFYIYNEPKNIPTQNSETYWYYAQDKLNQTQGSYSGFLLNGWFETFVNGNVLIEKGIFENGQKQGEWKIWYSNGKINRTETWKNGRLNGKFSEFEESGALTKEGKYENDNLEGKIKTYKNSKLVMISKYKNGTLEAIEVKDVALMATLQEKPKNNQIVNETIVDKKNILPNTPKANNALPTSPNKTIPLELPQLNAGMGKDSLYANNKNQANNASKQKFGEAEFFPTPPQQPQPEPQPVMKPKKVVRSKAEEAELKKAEGKQ